MMDAANKDGYLLQSAVMHFAVLPLLSRLRTSHGIVTMATASASLMYNQVICPRVY